LLAAGSGWLTAMLVAVALAAGVGVTWAIQRLRARTILAGARSAADRQIAESRERADEIVKAAEVAAQQQHLQQKERFDKETAEVRTELKIAERRLAKREDALDQKLDVLTTKEKRLEDSAAALTKRDQELQKRSGEIDQALAEQRAELLRISKLSPDQAKALCLRRVEQEVEHEAAELVDKIITTAQENAREKARNIIIQAIQRYAAEHTCESVVATVDVPSDDMKGRVIGREGRNIRAFEKATGVTVIVDDTPGIVSVSGFDPVRLAVARQALDRLIRDGRIHPTRIEEIVAAVGKEIEQQVAEGGRQAAMEAHVNGLHKKVSETLGRLQFRTSYGQNVLRHSVEVAHLCGVMADELGLDGQLARRCGLLHDIGKALDHEAEGGHPKIGSEFCRRFNEPPAVLNAIAGHHGDIPATHPYTPLVAAADAISASRPGGRRESLERYIKRLQDLEAVATSFKGVTQAYAVEAGREVRVIVNADDVDDTLSFKLARDIADKIEKDIQQYPGEIKVTVLREIRAVEYAR